MTEWHTLMGMRYFLTIVAAFVLAAVAMMPALANPPIYRYGEGWWNEYESDPQTALLLHFGPAQISGRDRLEAAVAEKKRDEKLFSLDADDLPQASAGGLETMSPEELKPKQRSVDETPTAAGTIRDYSNERQIFPLASGFTITPDGRFGRGLACSGAAAQKVTADSPTFVECWIRFDDLPAKEQCIFSCNADESRLLLRPDGRLELRLKKPHGVPNPKLPPAQLEAIFTRDSTILSPDPVAPKTWTHVAIWNRPHPMPGGGEPFDAVLTVNGSVVANYMSERHNQYGPGQFFGSGKKAKILIGNSAAGDQGFVGAVDELRVSNVVRELYERPPLPWRDAHATRSLQFNRPFFRADGTVLHASVDSGTKLDIGAAGDGDIRFDLRGEKPDGLLVDGVRGKGWFMDPDIGFVRVPLRGMSLRRGALEFWLRPVNWDDCTGYWHHSPPKRMQLSVARLFAKDKAGNEVPGFEVSLPRAFNLERARVPLDPGHWVHLCLVWDEKGWGLYCDGKVIAGRRRDKGADLDAELTAVEFGVNDDVTVQRGEKPRIEIDEIVGYRGPLRKDEVDQARKRWMGALEPIPLYEADFSYKWSIRKLGFSLVPLLPEGIEPTACTVSLHDLASGGKAIVGPVDTPFDSGAFRTTLSEGREIPHGKYQFRFAVKDVSGKTVAEGTRNWNYGEEPWRHSRAGILDEVPPPWAPIEATADSLATRMTRYTFGGDGLPREIVADGENLLAAPVQILEDGRPMAGKTTRPPENRRMEATWAGSFTGTTCDIEMECRAEYDGMIRYAIEIKPKGKVDRIAFVVPMKAAHATRWLAHPAEARGVSVGEVPATDGVVISSRGDPKASAGAYGFYTHADLNDMNRGLWWFCDNAAGWAQSKKQGAIEVVRRGDVVTLELNLVAEPCDYEPGRPIVFAILPHPARPMPKHYRLFDKERTKPDPRLANVYDAFFPWPKDPRGGGSLSMQLYPAVDPKKPEAGPNWEYAETCIPSMKSSKPNGLRTMYLSKAYFSCRAGAYDNWEWRSGEGSTVSLTPSFVNYLCHEMDEWIRRDFWDAVYLDECYEHSARNLEAGMSVRLPDGTEQPGVTNFQFRELMKRWRGIFIQHGREPFLLSHLTYSFQYHGTVFCDTYLDGENAPVVSLTSRDWIDSTSKPRFEILQNGRLWGSAAFYMPFIAEGGFADKEKSQFPRWQWRMARQAQSEFAHYETATVYEGQGSRVYDGYWNDLADWGGADEKTAEFVPYWNAKPFLKVAGQGEETLVSFYRTPGQVFLVASNRAKQDEVLRIELDPRALGLPATLKVRGVDRTFDPPAGEDFTGTATVANEAKQALAKSLADAAGEAEKLSDEEFDELLEGGDAIEVKKKAALDPRLEGTTLLLPVRARDYRTVVLE
jgi:hypothetical protein